MPETDQIVYRYFLLFLLLIYIHIVTYATPDQPKSYTTTIIHVQSLHNCVNHKTNPHKIIKTITSIHITIQYNRETHLNCCDKAD